ncbi:MAG: hypothetical protein A6D92_13855 [Symbiobacterium thermophilum]|uniref:MoaD/ThiS family protein n=1 Tax=Symbiobacterium thermophilum TaxID=2734 RepID=A0A1Y2T4M0_SYMTR|nr:MAG: hypothetical protein A6D92_13855 [Symbiobacterium thermophilum]
MVTVRLFGTLRLDAGRRRVEVDAATVAEALEKTAAALGLADPGPLLQAASTSTANGRGCAPA